MVKVAPSALALSVLVLLAAAVPNSASAGAAPLTPTPGEVTAPSTRANFDGIWSSDQGVVWDTSVRGGQLASAPFTPAYAAIYKEAQDAIAAGRPKADPPARCLPPGVPRIMASPFPIEIIQTPHTIYMLYEYMSQIRRVFMDGKGPTPLGLGTFNGYSTGRWDGDVLVIETSELLENVLDTTGVPVSAMAKTVERLRLLAPDKMEAMITIVDPKAYTAPWTVRRTYTKRPGERILQYVCEENNRNPMLPDGTTGFIGPQ